MNTPETKIRQTVKRVVRLLGRPCRAAYGKRVWYRYILPRRLTLKSNPAIYRWLWWNFGWHDWKQPNH